MASVRPVALAVDDERVDHDAVVVDRGDRCSSTVPSSGSISTTTAYVPNGNACGGANRSSTQRPGALDDLADGERCGARAAKHPASYRTAAGSRPASRAYHSRSRATTPSAARQDRAAAEVAAHPLADLGLVEVDGLGGQVPRSTGWATRTGLLDHLTAEQICPGVQ